MTPEKDPFSEFRLSNRQKNAEFSQRMPNNSQSEKDPFEEFKIKEAEGFPGIYEAGRHAARIGSRIAETIGGIPGDISSLIQSGVFAGLEKLGMPVSEETQKKIRKGNLPTREELKEFSEETTGGFTAAKNPTEKSIDEFVEMAASLLGPMKFRKSLGVALGSQAAKEGLKILGVGEGSQEAAKLGTMFALSVLNPGGALKYASSQFDKANSLAKGASVTATTLENGLNSLMGDLQKGITTPAKEAVIKPIKDILNKVSGGQILVEDLTATKRDLSTLMKDPALLQREKKLLKGVARQVDNAIKPYESINPAFSKSYRPANEIYGAVMEARKASNFISKILGSKSILGAVVGETILGHPEYILPTVGTAAAAIGTAKGVDFFVRLAKSPELMKFYTKAMTAAIKEDAGALRFYANKIEKEIDKSNSQVPFQPSKHKSKIQ